MEAEPVEVGKTVVYIVEITNNTDETMTGLSWRDVAFDGEPTALDDLDVDESVTVTVSFGPVQKLTLPGIILTVAVDSDQTEVRLASRYVQLVPGNAKATPPVRTVERPPPRRPRTSRCASTASSTRSLTFTSATTSPTTRSRCPTAKR